MKKPVTFLTNTVVETGRAFGAAKNNPGDNTGTGADKEIYNDPAYAAIAVIESYKESGISDSNETTVNSDLRDALEEMTAKKVSGISEWNSATLYSTHQLVMYKGLQFYAHNITGNLAKPPIENPNYWYYAGSPEKLIEQYFNAEPLTGGMHDISDRSHANYKQSALVGKYRIGGKGGAFYNFYRVALDGTQITGNANLESIFNGYFKIDKYAPDVAGTRTLIDMASRHIAPQSNGGDNPTTGALLEDRFQGHWHIMPQGTGVSGNQASPFTETDPMAPYTDLHNDYGWHTKESITDGVNGTPRTGLTTRPKEFTVGATYIIIAKPA